MSRCGEVWRPVRGWPYAVSSHGRVRRSVDRHGRQPPRALNPWRQGGYEWINLSDAPRATRSAVHHLVARAFIGPPPGAVGIGRDKYQINHKNGDKADNRPENLEWVVPAENRRHAVETGLQCGQAGEENPGAKLTERDVRRIKEMCLNKGKGESQRAVAEFFGIDQSTVSLIVNGKLWSHLTEAAA